MSLTKVTYAMIEGDVVNVVDYGADPTGTNDSTTAVQAAVNAGYQVYFPNGTYNISTPISLRSNSVIDLNGSTIEWTGAKFDNSNKAQKWNNTVFYSNLTVAPPSPIKYGVQIKNGIINVNDWGCGITFKQTEDFVISGITVNDAQCCGIGAADCYDGVIENCTLNDCAANPASGFNPSTDLEQWSDGMAVWYGSQNVSVNNCSVINTRVGTGRCGIFFEGTSTESGRITSQCSINNSTLQGYDRQFHVELSDNISAYDCGFNFVESGAKTLNSSVIVWNTTNTNLFGCRITSKSHAVTHIGGTRSNFIACTIESTNNSSGTELFRNLDNNFSTLKFTDCLVYPRLADIALLYCDAIFDNCFFETDTYSVRNFNHGTFSFTDCEFSRMGVRTADGTNTDTYTFTNCTWYNISSVQACLASPSGILKNTFVNCNPNGAQIYSDSPIELIGQNFYAYNTYGTGGPKGWFVNGTWMGTAAPTTQTWNRGDIVTNSTPSSGGNIGWVCTTAGTPGTWKTFGGIA